MQWWQAALLGGLGGASVSILGLYQDVANWSEARRSSKKQVPLIYYIDVAAVAFVLITRIILGAIFAFMLLRGRANVNAAVPIVLGFSAPTILVAFGQVLYRQSSNASKATKIEEAEAVIEDALEKYPADPGTEASR